MYSECKMYTLYMSGLKWKLCYKKSQVLASARMPPLVCSHFELDPWSGSEWKVADCGEVQWLHWTMITIPTITLSAGGRAQLTFTPCKVILSVRLDHRLKDQTKTKARWHQHNFYSLPKRDFCHQVKKSPIKCQSNLWNWTKPAFLP